MKKYGKQRAASGVMAVTIAGSAFSGAPVASAAKLSEEKEASMDTYVHNNTAASKGKEPYAVIGSSTNAIPTGINHYSDTTEDINIAYLTFDISQINLTEFDDVSLKLTIIDNADAANGALVSVFEASDEVDEDDTAWSNKPDLIDRVSEQGMVDNITVQDAVATGTVNGSIITVNGLGKSVRTAKNSNKQKITFAVYLNSNAEIKIATKDSTTNQSPVFSIYNVDRTAIADVEDAISDFPDVTPENYKSSDLATKRSTAINKYNSLTASEKLLVDNDLYTRLMQFYDDVAWNQTMMDYANAEKIINDINGISFNSMTQDNYTTYKQSIESAENAYNEATFKTKALIGNKTFQLLVNSRNKYNGFEALDVEAIKDKINAIGEVKQENYLDKGKLIVDAASAYEKYEQLMTAACTISGVLDQNKLSAKMSVLDAHKDILDEAEDNVENYKTVTAADFVTAWNMIREDAIERGTANLDERENLLITFEGDYYNSPINNLSTSAYYSEFADGSVSTETATAIEEYLCANYLLAVDLVHAEYGDPTASDFYERFVANDDGTNLYIYLYEYRAKAEEAFDKLSDDSKAQYADESDYCDKVYEAMMNLISAKTSTVLQLNIGDAVLTKDYIDSLVSVIKDRNDIPKAIIDYLNKYDLVQYNRYIEMSALIDSKAEDLAVLAQSEVDKYGNLISKIDDFGLSYMSGYSISGGVGTLEAADKYWNIAQHISEFEAEYNNINPIIYVGDETTTIIEYYCNSLTTDANDRIAKLTAERDAADVKITDFKSHNDEIVSLRSVAEACKQYIYELDLMLTGSEIAQIAAAGTYEEAVEILETIVSAKSGVTVDAVEQQFLKLYDEIEINDNSYNKLKTAYAAKHDSEGFTDISEPYISSSALSSWQTTRDTLLPIFCTQEDIIRSAETWIGELEQLSETVKSIDKEQEYLANDFINVYNCQDSLKALKDQYDGFDSMVKYYISSGIINSTDSTDLYSQLNVILNIQWPKAISVMDDIDASEAAVLTNEWSDKYNKAQASLNTLENNDTASFAYVAEAAKEKLIGVANDYELYAELVEWSAGVNDINTMIYEYAQLYMYYYDATSGDTLLVPSELSLAIDELSDSEIKLFDKLLSGSDKLKNYIDDADNGFLAYSAELAKLVKDKELGLTAEGIDKRILLLETLSGDSFVSELESLRNEINSLIDTIAYSDEDKRGNDAAILFNMLTQYAKYEDYIENYDKSIADSFIAMVEKIGTISYVTNLNDALYALDECDKFAEKLNDSQEKLAFDAIIKLGVLRNKYNRIYAAAENAQDAIRDIESFIEKRNNAKLVADPYDYEFVNLINGYNNILDEGAVVDGVIDAIKSTDAYQFLLYNGYIENYGNAVASFKDEYAYIGVMQAIEVLYQDSKSVIVISTDNDGNEIVTIDEDEKAILLEESKNVLSLYMALDESLKDNVLNYSSLQWLIKNIDYERVERVIMSIEALPDAEYITYAMYVGAVESVKSAYDALLSENQARVQAHNGGSTFKKLTDILIKMTILAEEYGELGGKACDVNGDDIVDINDVVMMVDFAFGTKLVVTPEDEKQFLRGNIVKEIGVSEEKIDFYDIAAVIDLLQFDN